MRGPSARVRSNTVDIYTALSTPTQDSTGGPIYLYPSTPTYAGVGCTAQPIGLQEIVESQDRVTMHVEWLLMFSMDQSVSIRDKVIYVDNTSTSHVMFVETSRDNASRGGAFTVRALEKV